ncbi:M16 family metallopeptidase [Myroides injenensis]|uniref:M16 family metallopeptidase n=1 Tax=Myroides injenensis TaxID=1183151 RepID=UPI0002891DD5|nr:M16 family metallopeptidase [Myroides injenensis]
MKNAFYYFTFFLVSFITSLCTAQDLNKPLPIATHTIIDSLENGFHYIIHSTKQTKTEYRLVLNTGSLQETNEEKGYAHFLEHMIFNGSTDFPQWKAVDTLQTLGYRYGRDINAYTTYERTVYQLSLQNPEETNLALSILANFLSKASLDDDAIEKERKIVIQEIKDFGKETPINQKKLEGTKHQSHLPIATENDILALDNQRLKAFYKKWYAPNLATLIVTGNVDPIKVQAIIKHLFRDAVPTLYGKRLQNIASYNPAFNSYLLKDYNENNKPAKLEIIRFTKSSLMQTEDDLKMNIIESLYKNYLLNKISQTDIKTRYHTIWYLSNRLENTFELEAQTKKELLNKVKQIASIVSTINRNGIKTEELIELKENYINKLYTGIDEDATYIADSYVDQAAAFSNYLSIEIKNDLSKKLIEIITPEDLQQLHYNSWLKDTSNLYLLTNIPSDFGKIEESTLLKAWKSGLKKTITFIKKEVSESATNENQLLKSFKWSELPISDIDNKPASLLATKYYQNIDVTELTLDNGLHIAIKPTLSDEDNIILSLSSRNGFKLLTDQDYNYFQDATYFIDGSWIKGLTNDDYFDLSLDKEISTLVSITDNASIINTVSRINNAEDLFEWSYRKLYNYEKPQEDFDDYIKESIASLTKEKRESTFLNIPSIKLDHKIAQYKNPKSRDTKELNTVEDWNTVNLDKIFSLYDYIVSKSDKNYIVLSGNFDKEIIQELAIQYFSKTPSIKKTSFDINKKDIASNESENKKITRENIVSDGLERPETNIIFKGKIQPTLKESIIAQMAREIFNDKFLNISREKEGLVYSPYTDIQVDIYPIPQTAISLSFSASEKDIPILEDMAKEVIVEMQTNEIDEQLLNRMKRTILNNKAMHLTEGATSLWAEKIREIYLNFGSIEDFNSYDDILQSITPKDVKEVCNSVFDISDYGVFSLIPEAN